MFPMSDLVASIPVILLDGLLASGSSIISTLVGRSYSFAVINGNQYLRDLGVSTGFVTSPQGTFEHEIQLLNFYEYITKERAAVHDQVYTFLTGKIRLVKEPTLVHCTGYAAYALSKQLPVKHTFWLQATIDDRAERLLRKYQIRASKEQVTQLKQRLEEIDLHWEASLQKNLGISLHTVADAEHATVDTSNLTTELAFQKLASIDSFIDAYNSLAPLMPAYHEEWRRWRCLVCQLVVENNSVIAQCPRCHNADPDKFKDLD